MPNLPGQRPRTPTMPPGGQRGSTNDALTRAIAERGLDAINEYRQQQQVGRMGRQGAIESGGYAPTQRTSAYDAYLESLGPSAGGYPISLGRTSEGDYAGFKTIGLLSDGLTGRAESYRARDREKAAELRERAMAELEKTSGLYEEERKGVEQGSVGDAWDQVWNEPTREYNAKFDEYMEAHPNANITSLGQLKQKGALKRLGGKVQADQPAQRVDPRDLNLPPGTDYRQGKWIAPDGTVIGTAPTEDSVVDMVAPVELPEIGGPDPLGVFGSQKARTAYYDSLEQGVRPLNDWLADTSGRYLEAIDTANQVANTPLRAYAQRAGADFGVDPDIIGGMFDEASQINDFDEQRDLDSLDQYGLPYGEARSAFDEYDERQQKELDAQSKARQGELGVGFAEATGGFDLDQMAQTLNIAPQYLYDAVASSPNYANAKQDIADNLPAAMQGDGDAMEAVQRVLDQLAVSDPIVRSMLEYEINGLIDAG